MKNKRGALLTVLTILVVMAIVPGVSQAQEVTNIWTGSTNTDWFITNNWSLGIVPTAIHHVVITNAANEILLTNSTANLASFNITSNTLIFTNWITALNASNVTVESGGELTLPSAFTTNQMSNCVHVVCTNFTLEIGGKIDAAGRGYSGGAATSLGHGTGGGSPLAGGGYGGSGGYGGWGPEYPGGSMYGSLNAPVDPGSGGGGGSDRGGNGGGAVRIDATETVTVHGTITANGGVGSGVNTGGGSGGSIFITCGTLAGSTNGILSANGADPTENQGGGGGGGRIAVIYDTTDQTNRPGVRFSTGFGKEPSLSGIAGNLGTVYLTNTVFLTETLSDQLFMNVKLFIPGFTNWSVNNLAVSNCIVTFGEEGFQLNVTNDLCIENGGSLSLLANSTVECGEDIVVDNGSLTMTNSTLNCNSNMTLSSEGTLDLWGNSTLNCGGNMSLTNGGSLYVYSGVTNTATTNYGTLVSLSGDLWIASNSWIYPYSHTTNGGSVLFRVGNLTIAADGGFNADELGFGGRYGPGAGSFIGVGGGAGYGGRGGWGDTSYPDAWPGPTNGRAAAPLSPGSGGGGINIGGSGGGLVRVEVGGAAMVDGTISACGAIAPGTHAGGGSGGAIFITCSAFAGTNGLMRVNGGNGNNLGGGGGGGRIAVWYAVPESERTRILAGDMRRVSIITNANEYTEFSGTISVTNGTGYYNPPNTNAAFPGTIVFLTVTPPSGTMFMCQ